MIFLGRLWSWSSIFWVWSIFEISLTESYRLQSRFSTAAWRTQTMKILESEEAERSTSSMDANSTASELTLDQWRAAVAWGPHRSFLQTFVDALYTDRIRCSPCPPATDHEEFSACLATCFPYRSSTYDFSKATKDAYAAGYSESSLPPAGFRAQREQLDFAYHGHYRKLRQEFQDLWMKRVVDRVPSGNRKPWAIFTAGAMGAGKGYVMKWLNDQGMISLESIAHVDPDYFKKILPEWAGYLDYQSQTEGRVQAGSQCHRESGLMVELAAGSCLQGRRDFWEDGSLRDADWYSKVIFKKIRDFQTGPPFRIALFHIQVGSREQLLQQVKKRSLITGRTIPESLVSESWNASEAAVEVLKEQVDFFVKVTNVPNAPPELTEIRSRTDEGMVTRGRGEAQWSEVAERFGLATAAREWGHDTVQSGDFAKVDAVFDKYLVGLTDASFLQLLKDLKLDISLFPTSVMRVFESLQEIPRQSLQQIKESLSVS